MSLDARILPNYSYSDYCLWEGRWELIEGIPYSMTPMPTPRHQALAGHLHAILLQELSENNCKHSTVYQPIDVKITENTVVNPDVLVVCSPIKKQFLDFPPALVIEILSPSTKLKDRYTKYGLYEEFGIKYYLIVDPEQKTIEVYQLNGQGTYEQIFNPKFFELEDGCTIIPQFDAIWS